ncbi:hypothetical protein A5760_02065 [Mycobacterium colombiense]|uniref:Uncharacterized protein n=1 Tax=Mycobacterium colombiense TaxID=339268 RepID=A0A1A0VXM2_9MYCO|nr:hypothetical protein A5760_02065 [Mycobacterium colombiense]
MVVRHAECDVGPHRPQGVASPGAQVIGCGYAPFLLIASLCIVIGCGYAPFFLIASLCMVIGCGHSHRGASWESAS